MKQVILYVFVCLTFFSLHPAFCGETVQALIGKLGNESPATREAAFKSLKERPESIPELRKALKSGDPEVRRRAAMLLEFFERRPIREITDEIKLGRIEKAVALLSELPAGKLDPDVWDAARKLAMKLVLLNEKSGGPKIKPVVDRCETLEPLFLQSKVVSETTDALLERSYFVRARDVDIDRRRRQPGVPAANMFDAGCFVVAARSVRLYTTKSHVILAGETVQLLDGTGEGITNVLIFSGGDVNLDCALGNSLVVARGKIASTRVLDNCQIISGKTVESKNSPSNCIITENEKSPFGFIRWADAPKEKAMPKTK